VLDGAALGGAFWLLCSTGLAAQTCTSQAKLTADVRSSLADAASGFAADVKSKSVAKLKAAAIAEYASNFSAAGALVSDTANKLVADTLKVVQVYQLDARARKPGDAGDAEFSCPLAGTAAETDFSISGLPPGLYGFAMVEANGDRPWLLSFLLRQEGGIWKLAGFYPHARSAAGHDGLWFWNSARDDAKAKQLWFAWLLYNQADALLRPANFASSTNLDKLRSEQRGATPPELANGIGSDMPLVVRRAAVAASGANPAVPGTEFRFTAIGSEGSDDGKRLNLVLHLKAEDGAADAASRTAANNEAARAFLNAHKELRQGFDGVIVIAEKQGSEPFVTEQRMNDIH
jgi:hypothetical protein